MSSKKDDSPSRQINEEETLEDKLKKAQAQAEKREANANQNAEESMGHNIAQPGDQGASQSGGQSASQSGDQGASQSGGQSASQSATNGDDSAKLQEELNNMTEMARRAMADLQNLKRRHEDERSQIIIMANARLITDILPILDNLQRAKQHIPVEITGTENTKEWLKGLEISINQLEQVLINAGVKAIESIGQKFNPDLHEAVAQDKGEKDTIIEEFEKGYTLSGRVLRHAKVKVGNGEALRN